MCIGCDELLTIKHILLEIRLSHFTAQSLHVLFQEISPEKIFHFLKEINISGKFKTQDHFWLCLCLSSLFKYGFKIVHIPILTCIHF